MRHRSGRRPLVFVVAISLAGCAANAPYIGQGPHPQITRGRPVPPIDALGNVFGIISKIVLLNWKMDRHNIMNDTEAYLVDYIDSPVTVTDGTHYSLNEYAPIRSLKRLVKNHKVAWPYRLLIGLPGTLLFDVLLPGRIFGGDRFNPYTDTVQLYSDLPAVALHEAGHTHDFNKRKYKGTWAFLRLLPGINLIQEYLASDEAVRHLHETGQFREECSAYELLHPAFATYVGGYIPFPGASVVGAGVGHITGRITSHNCRKDLRAREASQNSPATTSQSE